jgi:uncharacterized protein (DUF488 family)
LTVVIHTLGHSRHSVADFAALAKKHGVETVVDVRGQPWSRFNPQFNREPFCEALAAEGLGYRWEGECLSGRPQDRRFYRDDGKVDWAAVRAWPDFHAALDGVTELAGRERLALVCAEEDPLQCHRRFLLTPPLIDRKAAVLHIRKTGEIETEAETARRAAGTDARQTDLFD